MPRELSVKPIDRRCREFTLDWEGLGCRCGIRFSETSHLLARGDLKPWDERIRRMVILTWASIDFEVAAAMADDDPAEARKLRAWQESIDPVKSVHRVAQEVIDIYSWKYRGTSAGDRPSASVIPLFRPGRPTTGATAGPLTLVSDGALLRLHLLDAIRRAPLRSPLFARAEDELRSAQARLPDLEQRLSRRSVKRTGPVLDRPAKAPRAVRRPYDFSHLAS